jgi:hypothetical protein
LQFYRRKELITINDVPTSPIRDLDIEDFTSSRSTTPIDSFNKDENRTDSNIEEEKEEEEEDNIFSTIEEGFS